jgi:hypothetical protein
MDTLVNGSNICFIRGAQIEALGILHRKFNNGIRDVSRGAVKIKFCRVASGHQPCESFFTPLEIYSSQRNSSIRSWNLIFNWVCP